MILYLKKEEGVITGRNEVLAKVIFSQASACPQGGGSSQFSEGGPPNFWGVFLQIFRGVSSKFSGRDSSKFWKGVFLQILGGSSKFSGGVPQNLWGGSSKFLGGVLPQNMVNIQPVRILLECILFTGRNEVLAKVIFLHLSVILFTGGVPPNFRGVPQNLGGCLFGGFLQISGGGVLHRNTVNVRPVCILMECILVLYSFRKWKPSPIQ